MVIAPITAPVPSALASLIALFGLLKATCQEFLKSPTSFLIASPSVGD
jgi:hypothetical protein